MGQSTSEANEWGVHCVIQSGVQGERGTERAGSNDVRSPSTRHRTHRHTRTRVTTGGPVGGKGACAKRARKSRSVALGGVALAAVERVALVRFGCDRGREGGRFVREGREEGGREVREGSREGCSGGRFERDREFVRFVRDGGTEGREDGKSICFMHVKRGATAVAPDRAPCKRLTYRRMRSQSSRILFLPTPGRYPHGHSRRLCRTLRQIGLHSTNDDGRYYCECCAANPVHHLD